MDHYTALFTIASVLSFLGTFLIFVAGIVIISKRRSPAALLIFIGALLLMLLSVSGLIAQLIAGRIGSEEILAVNGFISVARGLSFLILSIGVLIAFLNIKKADE